MGNLYYEVVRVFTNAGKKGNELAVFPDASGFKKRFMQAVAKKLGFSETSFVLPAAGGRVDYRVRFFTPERELPFAGHPSLGTLYVLRRLGVLNDKKSYIQQIGKRLVRMYILSDGKIKMNQGKPTFAGTVYAKTAARMLRLRLERVAGASMVVSTGNPHLLIQLDSLKALEEASIDMPSYKRFMRVKGVACIMPFTVTRNGVVCRMFAPALGVPEDPATGSGCGPLAAYLVRENRNYRYGDGCHLINIKQGKRRSGLSELFAWVTQKNGTILKLEVGGYCRPAGEAVFEATRNLIQGVS